MIVSKVKISNVLFTPIYENISPHCQNKNDQMNFQWIFNKASYIYKLHAIYIHVYFKTKKKCFIPKKIGKNKIFSLILPRMMSLKFFEVKNNVNEKVLNKSGSRCKQRISNMRSNSVWHAPWKCYR